MSTSNLPPMLLARLQRRGILSSSGTIRAKEQEPEEEVIAEDYDDPSLLKGNSKEMAPGCPNKYNIYHDCSDYCFKIWGQGEPNPLPNIERKYNSLIKKYPLPSNWQKVWEPGLLRYYFWNTISDEVSWYPPSHPEAKLSLSVPKLKIQLKEEEQVLKSMDSDGGDDDDDGSSDDSNDTESDMSSYDSMESDDEPRKKQKTSRCSPTSNRHRGGRSKNVRNDLDPMDPASYSESCPRGKWSDGLETKSRSTDEPTVSSNTSNQKRSHPNQSSARKKKS